VIPLLVKGSGYDALLVGGRDAFQRKSLPPTWVIDGKCGLGRDWAAWSSMVAITVDALDFPAASNVFAHERRIVRRKGAEPLVTWLVDQANPPRTIGIDSWTWSTLQHEQNTAYLRDSLGADGFDIVDLAAPCPSEPDTMMYHLSDAPRAVWPNEIGPQPVLITKGTSVAALTGLRRIADAECLSPSAFVLLNSQTGHLLFHAAPLSLESKRSLHGIGFTPCDMRRLTRRLKFEDSPIRTDLGALPARLSGHVRFEHHTDLHLSACSTVQREVTRAMERNNDAFDRSIIECLAHAEIGLLSGHGLTEQTLADGLREKFNALEHFVGTSFPIIVASGRRSRDPHPFPPSSSAPIHRGDPVLIDVGVHFPEMTTDVSRIFLAGEASSDIKRYVSLVLKALISASLTNGRMQAEATDRATAALEITGLKSPHSLGHAILPGLAVHVPDPVFGLTADPQIPEGTIFTLEPAIYGDDFGVRLENTMFCTSDGFRPITHIPFDTRLIDPSFLTPHECLWLANYNGSTRQRHKEYLSKTAQAWLEKCCS
jgi:hypothetical protein